MNTANVHALCALFSIEQIFFNQGKSVDEGKPLAIEGGPSSPRIAPESAVKKAQDESLKSESASTASAATSAAANAAANNNGISFVHTATGLIAIAPAGGWVGEEEEEYEMEEEETVERKTRVIQ